MEVVRKYMDAESLRSIMTLPEDFKNRRVEVIILPVEETGKKNKKPSDVERAIRKLAGAVPYTDLSLEELRKERLGKYEAVD